MPQDLDRRTYDLLRLIDANEPIGSIRLVDLMQRRGYDIKGRTIRLLLSDLDESGLTEKVPGKGRRLTEAGRAELGRGDISGRLQQVRERISTLTSQVTYDPYEGVGEAVATAMLVPHDDLRAALSALEAIDATALGPVVAATEVRPEGVCFAIPSSITLDGVLLSHGIAVDLVTAGLVEYHPPADGEPAGTVRRYIDALSGEGSTMDVVSLLIEAGRTNVDAVVAGESGVLIVDNREFPITRHSEAAELAAAAREELGGVLDIRRPRESGPFPQGTPGWDFASLTYGGVGEESLALLHERGLVADWETLSGPVEAGEFERLAAVRAILADEGLEVSAD